MLSLLTEDGETTAVIFTFTFSEPGNYVFNDATNEQKILIITVMDIGESCSDPDRYVQTVSGESLSEIGVSQKSDIILKPNYSLIVAIGLILLFSTMIIMVLIFYCLHKDWNISDVDMNRTYREEQNQLQYQIYHESEEIFHK